MKVASHRDHVPLTINHYLHLAREDLDAVHPLPKNDDDPAVAAFQANAELWDRLEALGIARR